MVKILPRVKIEVSRYLTVKAKRPLFKDLYDSSIFTYIALFFQLFNFKFIALVINSKIKIRKYLNLCS